MRFYFIRSVCFRPDVFVLINIPLISSDFNGIIGFEPVGTLVRGCRKPVLSGANKT